MSEFPPDGWSLQTGVWGTDADKNTSIKYVGDSSIEFKATAVATSLKTDPIEIPAGGVLEMTIVARRPSGTVSLSIGVDYLDAALNGIGTTISSITFAAADVWSISRRIIGGISTHDNRVKFVKVTLQKTAVAEVLYVGALDFRVAHRGFRATKTADQTITAAGGTQLVTWDNESFDYGAVFNLAGSQWDPPADNTGAAHGRKHHIDYTSVWNFNARIQYNAIVTDAQVQAWIALFRNGVITGGAEGDRSNILLGDDKGLLVSHNFLLEDDDTVDVRTDHDGANDQVVEGTSAGTAFFTGWELSP